MNKLQLRMYPISGDFSLNDLAQNPNFQAYLQQMMYAQYLQSQGQQQQQPQPPNPYAQIVSNLSKESSISKIVEDKPDISKDPVIYGNTKEQQIAVKKEEPVRVVEDANKKPAAAALSLLQNYASDSEEESSEDDQKGFKVPDEETKVVIDKMACYVVKNGNDFENIVRSRDDPRFVFLKEDHEYYPYYRHKVEEETKRTKGEVNENNDKTETEESTKTNAGKTKEKKPIGKCEILKQKVVCI